jgi:hypothetical protein
MSEKSLSLKESRKSGVDTPIQTNPEKDAVATTPPPAASGAAHGAAPEYPSTKKRVVIMVGIYLSFFLITLVSLVLFPSCCGLSYLYTIGTGQYQHLLTSFCDM